MSRELFPATFEGNCGHQSHFFANAIKEMKGMRHKKPMRLGEAADEHAIVFDKRKMVDIIGPHGKCQKPSRQ
jgi:hypothetical protein